MLHVKLLTTKGDRLFLCRLVFFIALPLRGVRFRRSRKAAPDCRASIRLSITPVSSPSVREQIMEAKMITGQYITLPLTQQEEEMYMIDSKSNIGFCGNNGYLHSSGA